MLYAKYIGLRLISNREPTPPASLRGPSSISSNRAIGSTLADRYEEGEDPNATP